MVKEENLSLQEKSGLRSHKVRGSETVLISVQYLKKYTRNLLMQLLVVSDCTNVRHVARHPGKCAASVVAQSRVEPEH